MLRQYSTIGCDFFVSVYSRDEGWITVWSDVLQVYVRERVGREKLATALKNARKQGNVRCCTLNSGGGIVYRSG